MQRKWNKAAQAQRSTATRTKARIGRGLEVKNSSRGKRMFLTSPLIDRDVSPTTMQMESPHTNCSGKIGHSRKRLAQKWPSGSVFFLVYNDNHPHPGMDAAFPAGSSFGQCGAPGCWSRLGLAGFHKLVRSTLGLWN